MILFTSISLDRSVAVLEGHRAMTPKIGGGMGSDLVIVIGGVVDFIITSRD